MVIRKCQRGPISCSDLPDLYDAEGTWMCEEHLIDAYPAVEHQGWPTSDVLARRRESRRRGMHMGPTSIH